ncbi:sulfotransferase [Leisingera sp. M523]|uniref:sulfotransferase family protein n=1 Tax=Leisingera sp. M523 TaxID=2867013 RepID=UPI0021A7C5C3|nr:tetratricopeptide repeat-containing sulfotransferase family protein [Leisingera sp. M523]UWQ30729.1 sulfotransferase [Leisingera sp. M523]
MTLQGSNFQCNSEASETDLAHADRLIEQKDFAQALQVLLPVLKSGGINAGVLDRAAVCYHALGDAPTAISLMEFVTGNWPDMGAAWAKLAAMRQTTGQIEQAIGDLKSALKINPKHVGVLVSLNRLEPFAVQSSNARRLKELSKSRKLAAKERRMAHNAIGNIEAKAGNPSRAFYHFLKSKKLGAGEFDAVGTRTRVQDQKQRFQPFTHKEKDSPGPRVIFVCGLPRSGTTLVENILLRHSKVDSIGESEALKQTLYEVRAQCISRGLGQGYWDWAGLLEPQERESFRQLYFQRAFHTRSSEAPVIVDKMPLNCLALGLAQHLLPEARFVFMSRHPLDTGLSNIMADFARGNAFTRRMDWLGEMTRLIYDSAWDYQDKLGGQFRAQSYRALVSAPQPQIARLLEHSGLEWEDSCLSPEKSSKAVVTASLVQVRKTINTAALDKWKSFSAQLEPLKESLGGDEWIAEWEDWDNTLHGG